MLLLFATIPEKRFLSDGKAHFVSSHAERPIFVHPSWASTCTIKAKSRREPNFLLSRSTASLHGRNGGLSWFRELNPVLLLVDELRLPMHLPFKTPNIVFLSW